MSSKRKLKSETESNPKKPKAGHWQTALLDCMEDPSCIIQKDDRVVVIKDKFPKAQCHYLVMAKESINSIKAVKKEHLELIKHMGEVAEDLIKKDIHKDKTFNIGFHAHPSLVRLHMHVISDDFKSPCLKNKKHWNSFTTEFFINYKDILNQLKTEGEIKLPSDYKCRELMDSSLKCHKCDYLPKNFPDLKRHIITHK